MKKPASDVEAYVGGSNSMNQDLGIRFGIVRARGASDLAGALETHMHNTIKGSASSFGDPNPQYSVTPTQVGTIHGHAGTYTFQSQGRYEGYDAVNLAEGDSIWRIFVTCGDPNLRESAKRIIASISIKP